MSASDPRVSIVIRAYRREWLGGAIDSVLEQTTRDLELVIYDDAGGLDDIVLGREDDRLRYHRATTRHGPGGRYRKAVELCRGSYIGVLDDDDHYRPGFVARLASALDADPSAGMAFCPPDWDVGDGRLIPGPARPAGPQLDPLPELISQRFNALPSCMLVRREALDDVWRAHPLPDGAAPDVFVNVGVAATGWRLVSVDERLVVCRRHAGQLSGSFPTAHDIAVATFAGLRLQDPVLDRLRCRRLARAHALRATHRLLGRDLRGGLKDLAAARAADPSLPALARDFAGMAARRAARFWRNQRYAASFRYLPWPKSASSSPVPAVSSVGPSPSSSSRRGSMSGRSTSSHPTSGSSR